MSNRAAIEPTEFVSVRSREKTFGVRVYDDYEQTYDNAWDNIPDDDMAVLRKVLASDDKVIVGMMEHIQENQKGIYIGGNWYDWPKIARVFAEAQPPDITSNLLAVFDAKKKARKPATLGQVRQSINRGLLKELDLDDEQEALTEEIGALISELGEDFLIEPFLR